jgi:biotin carboxylase
MADHFALMTGRMITEATLQSAIHQAFDVPSGKADCDHHDHSVFEDGRIKSGVVVECRICQEEGDEAYMETPCSCKGSLKARFYVPLPA